MPAQNFATQTPSHTCGA